MTEAPGWYLYVVQCIDGSLYCGITTDTVRRIKEHNSGNKGAKYTRSRRPVVLIFTETCADRSDALRREFAFKQLNRKEKLLKIAQISS